MRGSVAPISLLTMRIGCGMGRGVVGWVAWSTAAVDELWAQELGAGRLWPGVAGAADEGGRGAGRAVTLTRRQILLGAVVVPAAGAAMAALPAAAEVVTVMPVPTGVMGDAVPLTLCGGNPPWIKAYVEIVRRGLEPVFAEAYSGPLVADLPHD